MTRIHLGTLALLAETVIAGISGCASNSTYVFHDAVGPIMTAGGPHSGEAQLVVFSAWDRFDTLDSVHQKHTPYRVDSDAGSTVAQVRNQQGSFGEQPAVLHLPPGKYWVNARATNVGQVRVPVVLREGQTTFVYLDGTTAPVQTGEETGQWIRQPNGLILGWKAAAE